MGDKVNENGQEALSPRQGGEYVATKTTTRPSEPITAPATIRLWREDATQVRTKVLPRRFRGYLRVKYALDFCLACLLAIPTLPVVLFLALLVRLTSKGPAFYTQTRVGENGRLFTILKLRTMRHNCEALSGPLWSLPGDPRVTPLGWFLRLSHLDELPQLWNVLRGEMSLIGPRPERPEFVPKLEQALPTYRQRLNVRPGVTGLAQVLLPPDSDIESVRRKLAHDLYYIRELTPWLEFRLLLCTACYALAIPFRFTSRLVGLPTSQTIERVTRDLVPETPSVPQRTRLAA